MDALDAAQQWNKTQQRAPKPALPPPDLNPPPRRTVCSRQCLQNSTKRQLSPKSNEKQGFAGPLSQLSTACYHNRDQDQDGCRSQHSTGQATAALAVLTTTCTTCTSPLSTAGTHCHLSLQSLSAACAFSLGPASASETPEQSNTRGQTELRGRGQQSPTAHSSALPTVLRHVPQAYDATEATQHASPQQQSISTCRGARPALSHSHRAASHA